MRVAIDAQLTTHRPTGIGEYTTGLIAALEHLGVDCEPLREPRFDADRFDRRVFWDQVLLPMQARSSRADLLHCTSGTMPLVATLPVVATVHDVAWLRVQRHTRAYARYYFGSFSIARYRHARRIVVDSHFSRAELLELAPVDAATVDVVYPGVAADIATIVRAPTEAATLLAVGTIERRKHLEVVIRALPALPDVRLVCVGPATPYLTECSALADSLGVGDRFDVRGYVDRAVLLDLYARATVAVVPSRYEGFGYGAAQALCAGIPLVAANASSLPEVARNDAVLVDPMDDVAWAAAITALLDDRAGSERRAANARPGAIARFSWTTAASAMRRTYEVALGLS